MRVTDWKLSHHHEGGTSPYTYNYQVYNSVTNAVLVSAIYSGVSSTSNTFTWVAPSNTLGNTIQAKVLVTDSATQPVTLTSANTITISIINSYTPPTTPSLTLSNSLIDQGQSILFTATFSFSTGPYTYNYQIVNSVTGATIANQLYPAVVGTTNTFLWTPQANLYSANTFKANVIVKDAHPTTTNSIYSPIGYNSALITPSISASNTIMDSNQWVTLNVVNH